MSSMHRAERSPVAATRRANATISSLIPCIAAGALLVGFAGSAVACEGVPVPFVAPGSSELAAGVQMSGGQITLRPKVNDDYFYEYEGWGSDDVDLCAAVTAVAGV